MHCLLSHVWLIYVSLACKLYAKLYDKTLFTLAYPFCLFVCLVCGFLLLRWSLIYWWEQMWELLVVLKVMETPLRSLSWVGSPCSKFSFKAICPMYYLAPWACILNIVKLLSHFVNGIVVCLSFLLSIMDNCRKWHFYSMTTPFSSLCVMFHLNKFFIKWDITISFHL